MKSGRSILANILIFSASILGAHVALAQDFKPNPNTVYEVIIYDAETIARINAPKDIISPVDAIEETESQAQDTILTPRFPRDISAEVVEVIAGVPIMEDPKSCGNGQLEIGVTVENVANSKGVIVADLHDDVKENFLVWDEVILRVRASATQGETKFCMPLTQPGEYAIAIYHDKNGNKEFDKNFLGIPSEHFGMSNNPKFGLKSPSYEEAAFLVPDSGENIRIKLYKAGDILGGQKK